MPLRPGTIVGGHRVIRVLGSGGMGTVYLVQDPMFPRRLDALKVLSADLSHDEVYRARFEREANLAAELDHPNIVTVYARGEEDGHLWIAMQYVPGTDAAVELKRYPDGMEPLRALRIITEVGKALDYAHRRGLLHRDVKPANFLLSRGEEDRGDDEERVLLTDFGVAKSISDGKELTATDSLMATVAYAAPERLAAEPLDHRGDIYSLGCAFVKLLTGRTPFPMDSLAQAMLGHLQEPPPPLSTLRPGLPPALDTVIAKALAKDPAQRYGTCREFTRDAELALQGQQPLAPPVFTPQVLAPSVAAPLLDEPPTERVDHPAPRRVERLRLALIITTILALLGLSGTAIYLAVDRTTGGTAVVTTTHTDSLAQVRSAHPTFQTKTIGVYNFADNSITADLDTSPQAKFLQDIGFRYATDLRAKSDETTPQRPYSLSDVSVPDIDVIIIVRTDKQAGNGGLRGLPSPFLSSTLTHAKLVIVDDPQSTQAFQTWTPTSPDTLIQRVIPSIAKVL
ncbi:serine/threonine-protein kinase [Nocardia sp. CDC160]|uniref:serine/threonine-protein kinase n=1 Tax=Nocardia sp. CDC160 TaxID=3112166 RepID=UPI002DB9421E|nr:serine/threonine-protein kinase [Nocardia sp. CDC160]MEC3915082.1 serine/threonine-protein kinase [Nocardia sp. CDC160]